MPLQGSFTSVQDKVPLTSNAPGDAPSTGPSRVKKNIVKKKSPMNKATAGINLVESVEDPAFHRDRYRYEPYRKVDPASEPERNTPADQEDLERLDVITKTLYENDREILESIEDLKHRTAAVLEHVNWIKSQLRADDGVMERIELFVRNRQNMGEHWTHQENYARGPDPLPTMARGAFPAVKEHISRDIHHGGFAYDYARDVFGGFAPRPHSKEDENGPKYVEDEVEVPPDFRHSRHAPIGLYHSTPDRSGSNSKISAGELFPPLFGTHKELKCDFMDTAAVIAVEPPTNDSRVRHPSVQSHIPSSPEFARQPESQHPVVPCVPSPRSPLFWLKRKHSPTPEDKEVDNVFGEPVSRVEHRDENLWARKRRMFTCQPSDEFEPFQDADHYLNYFLEESPTRENTPEHSVPASQLQKEDTDEIERSEIIEMLSREVEQGESSDSSEGSTENILAGFKEQQHPLPASTANKAQATSTVNTGSKLEAPVDTLGQAVLSANADKIQNGSPSRVSQKGLSGDVSVLNEAASNVSTKSIRFDVDDEAEEKVHKAYRKIPIKPRPSLRTTETTNALAAEIEAEGQDGFKPLPPLKKKRAVGARARKSRAEAAGLPSTSAGESPSELRRGRSTSVRPDVPTLRDGPITKPAHGRK